MKQLLPIVLVVSLIGAGVWYWKKQAVPTANAPTSDPYLLELDQHREKLRKWSSGSEVPEADVYRAMILLSEVKDQLSHSAALKAATSPSKYLREGAAQSLGPFDSSDATTSLSKLLEDEAPSVRQFALEALGKSSSSERKTLLEEQENKPLQGLDRIQLLSARFTQAQSESERNSVLSSLAEMSARAKETETLERATMKMVELAPTSKLTIQALKSAAEADRNATLTAIAVRQLSSQQDPWIEPRLKELSRHREPIVRKAVVQSLHRNCPRDRWSILKEILESEKDDSVFEIALEEPIFIPDREAVPALKSIAPRITTDRLKKIYEDSLKVLQEQSPQNPCGKDSKTAPDSP